MSSERRSRQGSATAASTAPPGLPFFIVTHQPAGGAGGRGVRFVSGVEPAVERALEAARDKDVHVMSGADVIRQSLDAGIVDELSIIIAPVVLGGGKPCSSGSRGRSTSTTSECGIRRSRPSSTIG